MSVRHVSHYLIRVIDQIESAAAASAKADSEQLKLDKAEAVKALAELESRKSR